jgi:four helix bundle protein
LNTQDFRKLDVWAKAHQLTLALYEATGGLPRSERYGLSTQVRRAAVSIESNIAEACGRLSRSEFRQFLVVALGSAKELDCQTQLCRDLGYIDAMAYRSLFGAVSEVQRMLTALIKRLI